METELVKYLFERSASRIHEKNNGDTIKCVRKKRMQSLNAFNAKSYPGNCNDRLLISKKFKFCSDIKSYI